ncbi:MAG: alpha/beta hydrolase [Acidimicrobiia bacterium]|nr:alpha/beta hydrolase [Acidimicrobiia bacterium]NNC42770.1 alpha/beta hydrolase [Acidimicrobiia bacterium]NNL28426.1 alpha/beta hydrolase [Acidimicrobiia bacterium]
MQVSIRGPVHFKDYGGKGPLILLIHGIASSSASWVALGPLLTDFGRVLAIDLPGFGRSPLKGRSADVESQADLVATFIERVSKKPAVIVGSSLGGLISFITAARYPETVERLLPITPAVPGIRWTHLGAKNLFGFMIPTIPGLGSAIMRWGSSNVSAETHVEYALAHVTHNPERIAPEVRAAIVKATTRWLRSPDYSAAYISSMKSLYPFVLQSRAFDEEVRLIEAPTHIIGGRKDPVVSHRNLERVIGVRPDWELTLLDDVGHAPHIEEPDWVAEIMLEWLRAPANA